MNVLQAIYFAGDNQRTATTTTIRIGFPRCGFTKLANDGTVSPTDELDAMKDLQNHEEFLKTDDELPRYDTNYQNYDDDITEYAAKENKIEDGERSSFVDFEAGSRRSITLTSKVWYQKL